MNRRDPILHAFELLARRDPLAPLVVSPERRATVGDVDALSRAAGALLPTSPLPPLPPLPPGTLVGLAAANGPGFLASFLALRRAGLAVLLLDARTPETEASRILSALGAPALLRCPTGWPQGPEDWSMTMTEITEAQGQGTTAPLSTIFPSSPDLAAVKLTSGSTGAPRGIATPAEALLADDAALTATMGLSREDRLLTTIPLSHSYGLSSLAVPALVRGTVLAIPEETGIYDPFVTAARTGATFFPTVPAYLDALVRMSDPPPRPACLRLAITAGAPLSAATSARFRERFGIPVHVFYGSSECGGICYDREGGAAERGTVGAPVEGVRVTIDEKGVLVESPAVSAGYFPDPDERLRDGRFRAGDLAVWKEGELALQGRVDDLVNIKGKKVNPREVESVLARLEGVEDVAVLGVPGASGGEMLRAVVACRLGRLTAADVVGWCRAYLSAHKVPRSVILVEELPRNARGKLDRAALRSPHLPGPSEQVPLSPKGGGRWERGQG
ncbi:MAG TPA: class I adenylate-forming enzyme family protein [Thermoanaerobaculia bacterium]|jgi:long-chain acyl-CoA synthetase|nr:class I adenylate-forming enzyme family protein [Thermoanaerobaculia bacterium]